MLAICSESTLNLNCCSQWSYAGIKSKRSTRLSYTRPNTHSKNTHARRLFSTRGDQLIFFNGWKLPCTLETLYIIYREKCHFFLR